MGRIALNPELRALLNSLDEQKEVCDENGEVVGQFLPQSVYMEMMYAWARAEFADEEELAAARAEMKSEPGMNTAQAIAHIEEVARSAKGT